MAFGDVLQKTEKAQPVTGFGSVLKPTTKKKSTGFATTAAGSTKQDLTTTGGLRALAKQSGLSTKVEAIEDSKGETPERIYSGGFITDVFDTLNLLQHGVTGTIQGEGFVEGVKSRASFSEKGPKGLGDYGIAGVIGGMIADMAVDPLTYAGGLGLLSKGAQAINKGSKIAGSLLTKIPVADRAANQLGKMFIYRFGQDPVYKKIAERSMKNAGIGIQNMLEIARPLTKLSSEAQRTIAEARKTGNIDTLAPELLAKAKPAFDELDRLGKEAVDVGLLSKEVYDEHVGSYLTRLYRTKEVPGGMIDKIKSMFDSTPKRIDLNRFKARKDIPEEVREAMGEILEAGYPTAKALVQLTQSIENAKFFKEVATKWGSDIAEEGFQKLPDVKSLGALAGKSVPTPIFDDIQEIIRTKSTSERAIGAVVRGFKFGKVILNPATHARNIMSNFVLNNFEGLSPARVDIYARAAKSVAMKDDLYKEAQQAGLGLDTYASAELRDILIPGGKGVKDTAIAAANKIADLYQKEEEFAKMAMYIFQRGKGLSPDESYKVAERATFNYAQVTPFIRRVRESAFGFPFITFTYKVTPQVVKTLATKPTKISNIDKIRTAIEEQSDQKELAAERETEPSWVRDGYYVKLPIKDKEGRSAYLDLTYVLPFGDLVGGNLFQRDVSRETGMQEGVTESVMSKAPLMNLIKELAKNQDFYGNKVYRTTDDVDSQLADVFRHLIKTYAPPIVADQIPGGYRSDNQRRPAQWQQLFADDQGTDFGGAQKRTMAEEMLRHIGIKINPVDLQTQANMADQELEKALRTLLKEEGVTAEFTRPFVPTN